MFLQVAAAAPLLGAPVEDPKYKVVTPFKPAAKPGMPGPYPGQVVRVHSEKSLDVASDKVDREVVRQMLATGMKALTGDADEADAWKRFISPSDVVGIKVNCSGAPRICSAPEIVGGIAENLVKIGVLPTNIYVYERFENQLVTVPYPKFLPEGAHIWAAETSRGSILGYDPHTYLETSFFGEEDTRYRFASTVILHDGVMYVSLALLVGHLYLALIHPATRHALRGMTLGSVSADWAARHHAKWRPE